MPSSDASIRLRWNARLVTRLALERAAKARHTAAQRALSLARADDTHPRQALVEARNNAAATLHARRQQVADARAVIARHTPRRRVVHTPAAKIITMANDWHPGHDGVDIITPEDQPIYAICDGVVIDVRASGWWGKGAQASHGHPISDGDGIIQIRSTVNSGPFRAGQHFAYGHAEHATVKVGQTVRAGDTIGRAGFANAPHVHMMVNDGQQGIRGVGTRDPKPFIDYARRTST